MECNGVDAAVLAAYNAGIEQGRLRGGLGLLEAARTRELLLEFLPPPPAVVYDVGGGYGEYAWWLAARGYQAHLFDLADKNIELAAALAAEYPGTRLAGCAVADARRIDRPDHSADAVLLMGPLYHLTARADRLAALRESRRLLRPGGRLFAAAITPFATLLWAVAVYRQRGRLLEEPAFLDMVRRELDDGQHIPPPQSSYRGIGRSFFHRPNELRQELAEAGFSGCDLRGVVGAGWLAPDLDDAWREPAARKALLDSVRLLETQPEVLGLSTHLLAIAEA